jgi:hypothetical protein
MPQSLSFRKHLLSGFSGLQTYPSALTSSWLGEEAHGRCPAAPWPGHSDNLMLYISVLALVLVSWDCHTNLPHTSCLQQESTVLRFGNQRFKMRLLIGPFPLKHLKESFLACQLQVAPGVLRIMAASLQVCPLSS